MADPITWDSPPDYDEWGIDEYWTCSQWIEWYYHLKSYYGKAEAVKKFREAFAKGTAGAHHFRCNSPYPFPTQEYQNFNRFMNEEGILRKGTLPEFFEDITSGVTTSAKVFKIVLPLAVIFVLYRLTKRLS